MSQQAPTFALEDTYIQTSRIRLHVVQAGPRDGPLVVLLHGFPEYWAGWHRQIGPLAQAGFRVAVPDQRGYNLSDAPKGVQAYRLDELAKDVTGLLDALGRETCCLAGHDWGAAVGWHVALTNPRRVTRLAIHNVPHPRVMMAFLRKSLRQMIKSWYIGFFQIPGLADWSLRRDGYRSALSSLVHSSRPGTFSDADLAQYRQAWTNSGGLTGMINWYRALLRYPPPAPRDDRLPMPVLVQWGKLDRFLSHEMAEASLALCDQGRLIFYEDATHWVQHEKAEQVSQALVEFFR